MKKWLGLFLVPLVLAVSLSPATFQPERFFTSAEMYSSDVLVFDRTAAPDQDSTVDFSLPLNPVSLMPNHRTPNDFNLSLITPIFAYNSPAPSLDGVLVSFYPKKPSPQDDVFFSDYCSTYANCMSILDHQLTFGGGGGQKSPGTQNNDPANSPIVTASNFPPPGPSFGNGNGSDTNPIFGTPSNGQDHHRKPVATPEPSSLVLLLAGLAGLALLFKLRG